MTHADLFSRIARIMKRYQWFSFWLVLWCL